MCPVRKTQGCSTGVAVWPMPRYRQGLQQGACCQSGVARMPAMEVRPSVAEPLQAQTALIAGEEAAQKQANLSQQEAALQKLVDLQAADEIVTTRCSPSFT